MLICTVGNEAVTWIDSCHDSPYFLIFEIDLCFISSNFCDIFNLDLIYHRIYAAEVLAHGLYLIMFVSIPVSVF